MIFAAAGRRIDAPGASEPVFAYPQVEAVRGRVLELFRARNACALVCSAACGADLVALEAAASLGLRRRVILPFAPHLFRQTSVVDRPGHWGPLFDLVVGEVEERGDLVNLNLAAGEEAYLRANQAILQEASALGASSGLEVMAVLIWDGVPRAENDLTKLFGDAARSAGLDVAEISTL